MYRYKKIKLPDGSTKDEHRLAMEQYLGRILDSNEVVHHCDGNGRNNKIDNLELMLKGSHASFHKLGKDSHRNQLDAKSSTGFRGVYSLNYRLEKKNLSKVFFSQITYQGRKIWLGYFKTAEEAAKAYDDAAIKYFKDRAITNTILRK